jgi:hypothetical protein
VQEQGDGEEGEEGEEGEGGKKEEEEEVEEVHNKLAKKREEVTQVSQPASQRASQSIGFVTGDDHGRTALPIFNYTLCLYV